MSEENSRDENRHDEKMKQEIENCGIKESAGYKNIIAIRDYATDTRTMFRNLQKENELYLNQIKQFNIVIEQMKTQMQQLQIKLYNTNSTS